MRTEQEAEHAIELYADMIRRICLLHLKNHTDGTTFLNDGIQAGEIVEKAHETLAG